MGYGAFITRFGGRAAWGAGAAVIAGLLALVSCGESTTEHAPPGRPREAPTPGPTTTGETPKSTPAPTPKRSSTPAPSQSPSSGAAALAIGPISFFQKSCARCHGSLGMMYAETMASSSDAKLRADIERMVKGPGQTSLGDAERESLLWFHRAIAKDEPFVVVTSASAEWLEGEATPDTLVRLEVGGSTTDVERTGDYTWRVRRPAAESAGAVIIATRNGKSVRCDITAGATSHTPAPAK